MASCIEPIPLSDDDLLDALDSSANEAIQNHLRVCVSCSERLDLIRKLERGIHTLMYRSTCPPAEALADYVMSVARAELRHDIEKHLETCVLCQSEIQQLQTILTASEAPLIEAKQPEPFWKQVKNRWQDFEDQIVTILVPRPLLATNQLRGAGDRERVLNYEHESVTVMLRLEKVVDGLKINGTIIDSENEDQWLGGYAELTSDQKRFIAVIDDDENFTFDPVIQGLFQLSIYAISGRILRLKDIDLTL